MLGNLCQQACLSDYCNVEFQSNTPNYTSVVEVEWGIVTGQRAIGRKTKQLSLNL